MKYLSNHNTSMLIRRCLHTSRCLYKNPYYFYDLARRQPKSSFDPLASFDHNVSAAERMSQVFGSVGTREASRKAAELHARVVAGIKVPARPEEPTNCCMSGCVNCVWEQYKDELSEWRQTRKHAKTALFKRPEASWPEDFGPDERKTNAELPKDEDDWSDLPVSIRVFVETEKRLRRKKQEQQQQQLHKATLQQQTTV